MTRKIIIIIIIIALVGITLISQYQTARQKDATSEAQFRYESRKSDLDVLNSEMAKSEQKIESIFAELKNCE